MGPGDSLPSQHQAICARISLRIPKAQTILRVVDGKCHPSSLLLQLSFTSHPNLTMSFLMLPLTFLCLYVTFLTHFLKQMDFQEGGGGGENTAERTKLAQI